MPMRTIQTDDDSSFELNSYGTSDNAATKTSAHEVNVHRETIQPTLPLTIGDHQDDQSAQDQSVDRLVKFEQNLQFMNVLHPLNSPIVKPSQNPSRIYTK
jgi:hypothetical protein